MIISQGLPHDAVRLLRDSVAFIQSLYPEEHAHSFNLGELSSYGSRFFIATHDEIMVGCAAYVWHDATKIELKHMFVSPQSRGLGCGRALLEAIECQAVIDQAACIILETSQKQDAAIRLYESANYLRCAPYTEGHDEDVFMMKVIADR